jgi:molecular chaperone GrpE
MVKKEFISILKKHGINKIEALNQKFDHNLHQAMMEIESEEAEEGIVIQEIQSGYNMHDRLLRPSMVGVAKKPNKDEKKK